MPKYSQVPTTEEGLNLEAPPAAQSVPALNAQQIKQAELAKLEATTIEQQVKAALKALEALDFTAYMEALIALGTTFQNALYGPEQIKRILNAKIAGNKGDISEYSENRDDQILVKVERTPLPKKSADKFDFTSISAKQKLAFEAFQAVWKAEEITQIWEAQKQEEAEKIRAKMRKEEKAASETNDTTKDTNSVSKEEKDERQLFLNQLHDRTLLDRKRARHLRVKDGLKTETRMDVSSGLVALAGYLDSLPISYTNAEDAAVHPTELDKQAATAIMSYKTKKQKALHYLGVFIGGLTSFIFGAIEGGVGLVVLLLATSCPPVLAYGLGIFIGVISTKTNWYTFRHYISQLLHRVVGKDKWFDGLTEYTDAETGERIQLSGKKLLGLGAFGLFAALPTGIAIGALGYGLTTSIPAYFGLGVISAAFPPIGVAFAVVVTLGMTLMLVENMRKLLHNKNVVKTLKEPFENIGKILEEKLEEQATKEKISPARRAVTKFATYAVMALFALVSLAGLVVTCIGCKSQLSSFLTNALNAAPGVATGVGLAVGGFAAFISRMYFTFNSAVKSAVALCKKLITGEKVDADREELRNSVIDSASAGIFFAYALFVDGLSVAGILILSALAAMRTFALDFAHVLGAEKSPEAVMKEKSSADRITQLTDTQVSIRLAAKPKEQFAAQRQLEAPEGKVEVQEKAEKDPKKKPTFFITADELSEARDTLEQRPRFLSQHA